MHAVLQIRMLQGDIVVVDLAGTEKGHGKNGIQMTSVGNNLSVLEFSQNLAQFRNGKVSYSFVASTDAYNLITVSYRLSGVKITHSLAFLVMLSKTATFDLS
jgi:hypothetical protein